jgi:hypothetical protein
MYNNLESIKLESNKLSKSIKSQQQLLELMHNQSTLDTIGEIDLSIMIGPVLSQTIEVNYENGILSELIASGGLKDIEKVNIINDLASWDVKVYKLRDQEPIFILKLMVILEQFLTTRSFLVLEVYVSFFRNEFVF